MTENLQRFEIVTALVMSTIDSKFELDHSWCDFQQMVVFVGFSQSCRDIVTNLIVRFTLFWANL